MTKTRKYRSKLERLIAEGLDRLDVSYDYESQKLDYELKCVYTPDFILENGIILEAKGYFDASARRKMRAVKAAHPDADIRFIFQNPEKLLSKSSSTTYADWSDKHGFPYCPSYSIPKSWLF